MSSRLPLQAGTLVIAVRNFGAIEEGTPGIITGTTEFPFLLWSRPYYLCSFAGGIPIAARPKEINAFDHGFSRTELEHFDEMPLNERGARIDAFFTKFRK
jgi:hypothetical protein